ncbi:heme-dependent oxidative N-demethylase subunit alpha family protein [Ponticaulis profundi]
MRTPPYLPFLDGPARVAPLLKPIPMERWLTPDTEAEAWLPTKRNLMEKARDEVFAARTWAEDAMQEAARDIHRALGPTSVDQLIFPTEFENASGLISDDVCVMIKQAGEYKLAAASLCAPTFWSLTENIGKPLAGLHGPVPGGAPELSDRINRVFDGLQPGMVLERFNWTVQYGAERYTPTAEPMKLALANGRPEEIAPGLHLRVERQTVRKLTRTGAVLFCIRVCTDPLSPILANEAWRKAFTESWNQTEDSLRRYKGWDHYEHVMRACFLKQD